MMEIQIFDDFDLDKIAESGQCFRWVKEEDGTYRIPHREHCLRIRQKDRTRYQLSCTEEEFRDVWHDYFDLGEDYRAIRGRIRREDDPFLYAACEFGAGIRILRQDPWETLVSFIISQNKNIPAIKKSIELLCKAAGRRPEPSGAGQKQAAENAGQMQSAENQENVHRAKEAPDVLYRFPAPCDILALSDETLAACRLGYRCRYVRAAAEDVAQGRLDLARLELKACRGPALPAGQHPIRQQALPAGQHPDRQQALSEEGTISTLTSVCGVGIKVASCVSLFGLHHIDAFPIDVWVRRILENEYPAGYPKEKYTPYNGIYQQYMFYYYREKYGRK